MSPESQAAMTTLRRMERGHSGASSGERAAGKIVQNLQSGTALDFANFFVRLDGTGKRAVAQLLVDLASGKTGLLSLR